MAKTKWAIVLQPTQGTTLNTLAFEVLLTSGPQIMEIHGESSILINPNIMSSGSTPCAREKLKRTMLPTRVRWLSLKYSFFLYVGVNSVNQPYPVRTPQPFHQHNVRSCVNCTQKSYSREISMQQFPFYLGFKLLLCLNFDAGSGKSAQLCQDPC